jgi:hypothetical protein
MIYSKLEGTTSKQFKVGKNGIQFQLNADNSNILEILTPNGGMFTIGLADVYEYDNVNNTASLPVANNNAIPTAVQIKGYIEHEVEKLLGSDFSELNELLNSLSELAAAIGNDPEFFSNIGRTFGLDYYDPINNTRVMPSNIPDEDNDGSDVLGKDGLLDPNAVDLADRPTVSKRLSILEEQKSGQRLSRLNLISNDTNRYADKTYKDERTKQMLYIYEETVDGKVIQKKISLDELRKLRPGIYTGMNGKDMEDNDYVFEPLN